MTKKHIKDLEFNPQSWFDDHGRVFGYNGRIYRGIYKEHIEFVEELLLSGLINKLIENELFPETEIAEIISDEFPLILEHKKIDSITYPYEWSFSMLKDAAKVILEVNRIANEFGYQLKDCHGYNVLFDKLTPKFIDFGSFIKYDKFNCDWFALDEFVRYYLYPLKFWSKGHSYFSRNFLLTDFGIIPHSGFYMYKFKFLRLFKPGSLDQLFKIWYVYRRFYSLDIDSYDGIIKQNKLNFVRRIHRRKLLYVPKLKMENWIRKIENIKMPILKTQWGNYHSNQFDSIEISDRFLKLLSVLNELPNVNSAIDIAANQGYFSNLILNNTNIKKVISTDYDEGAVDIMYNQFKNANKKPEAIVLQNFIKPVSKLNSISPNERFKCDVAIALALTHHLFLTQHIPIGYFFELIKKHSNKYVLIEFMPLGLFDGTNNPLIPEWYNVEWFRNEFLNYFEILNEELLEENRILFVGKIID